MHVTLYNQETGGFPQGSSRLDRFLQRPLCWPDRIPGTSPRDKIGTVSVVVSYKSLGSSHPSLTENRIIGDEVFPAIALDPAKITNAKIIQNFALTGSDVPSFIAI